MPLASENLDLAGKHGVAGISDGRDKKTEQLRTPGLQLLCRPTGLVAGTFDRGLDARERLLAHLVRAAVEYVGYGRNRDPGFFRDLIDGDHAADLGSVQGFGTACLGDLAASIPATAHSTVM